MKSQCFDCKKSFSGKGITVTINGEERNYCANCLWKLQKEYSKKKSCEDCGYFDEESCQKTGRALVAVKAGFNTYFVDAESCRNFSTQQKADHKKKESSEEQKEATALVKRLAESGQTLTVYCCHCGAPIKMGAKAPEIPDTCLRCRGDLEIINLAKFIKQHQ